MAKASSKTFTQATGKHGSTKLVPKNHTTGSTSATKIGPGGNQPTRRSGG